jgi:hypothetical protein
MRNAQPSGFSTTPSSVTNGMTMTLPLSTAVLRFMVGSNAQPPMTLTVRPSRFSRPRTLRRSRRARSPPPPSDVFGVPGSRPRPHAPDIERLSALVARNDRVHVVVARGVVENERRKVAAEQPFVAEGRHTGEDRTHVAALVRKALERSTLTRFAA